MALSDPDSLVLVRFRFRRGLALVYLVAFVVAATQFRPLAGEDGLRPLGSRVDRHDFLDAPSLFQLAPDDRAIDVAAWLGVGLSMLDATCHLGGSRDDLVSFRLLTPPPHRLLPPPGRPSRRT